MRYGVIFAALLGVALAAWLVVSVGFHSILSAALAVGWAGFTVLCVFGATLFALLGAAWFALVPRHEKPRVANFIWSRAVRECAGELLPFSQVGGIVIGARALMLRNVRTSVAFASAIVDVTVEMIAQIVFIVAGLAILIAVVPHSTANAALTRSTVIGIGAAVIAAALFLLLQQRGLLPIARWSSRHFPKAGVWLRKLHDCLGEIRASPIRLAISFAIHICGWTGTALWAWIALRLIGRPVSFPLVFAIEAILYAIRSAAVLVPGALGVQEASYVLLGPLFGIAAPVGIALSLLKRARDVALGVPVLLAWQFTEGGRAIQTDADPASALRENRAP
jgi:putative membrane protein